MTPIEWLLSDDTGRSSKTILFVMMKCADVNSFRPDVIYDSADLGRCLRLIELFPEWRPRLHEVSDRFPIWGPVISEWDNLERRYNYLTDSDTAGHQRLYEQIQGMIKKGRREAERKRKNAVGISRKSGYAGQARGEI